MKTKNVNEKAEKCGICFFIGQKPVFTTVKTSSQKFDNELIDNIYLNKRVK